MKLKFLFSLFFFLSLNFISFSQDTIRIIHSNYTTVFNKSKKYPVLVQWWLTKSKIECTNKLTRKDAFQPDPLLPNETDLAISYKNSGFDRGHMMPAAENLCQTPQIMEECFYFSNMSAQYHSLNAGDWKSVETFERELSSKNDSLKIWCGNLGELQKIGTVSVPKQCWKVIFVKKTNEWFGFLFTNDKTKPNGYQDNIVTVKEIEKLTGFKFR